MKWKESGCMSHPKTGLQKKLSEKRKDAFKWRHNPQIVALPIQHMRHDYAWSRKTLFSTVTEVTKMQLSGA